MSTRFSRKAAAAVGLALLAGLGAAAPAMAAPPSITFLSPIGQIDDDAVTVSARVAINGTLTAPITLKVSGAHASISASAPPEESPQTVSFPVKLAYNGAYSATITATGRQRGIVGLGPEETATQTIDFLVAAPATPPTGVKAVVDAASRAVTVTWKANPEPDLIRYEVKRAKGTSNDFTVLAKPKAGDTSYLDASTASGGGDYRYLVVAVRAGVPGDEELTSDPSALTADAVAKVPDPPPPPTTAAPAVAGTPAAGAGTASSVPAGSPGAVATPGKVDLSGFDTVRGQTRSVTPRTVPLPDPGFQSTLPFPSVASDGTLDDEQGGGDAELAADGTQYRELGAESSSDSRARTMTFFAAGLLATVLLMHVLWVKSEVNRIPLEVLDPEVPSPGDAWEASSRTGRLGRRKPAPAPTLDDIGAPDFAPVVVATDASAGRKRPAPASRRARPRTRPEPRREVPTSV